MKLSNRQKNRHSGKVASYWQSYSDLMSALLLVFVLLMSSILLQSSITYQTKLAEQRLAEEELLKNQSELEQQKETLQKQQMKLQEQQERLNTQENVIDEQKELLENQKQQIDRIIGVKVIIIEDLVSVFSDSNLSVNVDNKTGAITLDSEILFDLNQSTLKPEGKAFLDKFIPLYFGVLSEEDIEPYVSEIIIEGHTDTSGTYINNLKLSQERAFSVVNYIYETYTQNMSEEEVEHIRALTTANGRAWNDLIFFEDGTEDADSSRRVEFKFRLKDDEMINAMAEVLKDE